MIVRLITGLPTGLVKVTVALRAVVVGLACAVITTVPSPVPVVGATVNQLLVDQVPATRQSVFEATAIDVAPPLIAAGVQLFDGDTVKVAVTPA